LLSLVLGLTTNTPKVTISSSWLAVKADLERQL